MSFLDVTVNISDATTTDIEHVPGINHFTCFLIMMCLGAISAIITKTLAAPIERIKVIQQCRYEEDQSENTTQNETLLKYGILSLAKHIYREEGIAAFWRGNWATCVWYLHKFALDMAFLEQLKGTLKTAINPGESQNFGLILASKWTAGVIASTLSTIIVYPLDFVRTQLAADMGEEREFNGIFDCIKKTAKKSGIFSLYSGLIVTVIGDIFYRGTKYGMYESLKDPAKDLVFGENDNRVVTFFFYFVFGTFVTVAAQTISYPFDTVRRVLMVDTNSVLKQYDGFYDCFQKLYAEFGITRFYRGLLANITKAWSSGLVLALFNLMTDAAKEGEAVGQCYTLYNQ